MRFREKKLQQQAERAAARANERAAIRDAKAWMKKYVETLKRRRREEERTAAAQRAALSPLAELRWEYSDTTKQDGYQPPLRNTPSPTDSTQRRREKSTRQCARKTG